MLKIVAASCVIATYINRNYGYINAKSFGFIVGEFLLSAELINEPRSAVWKLFMELKNLFSRRLDVFWRMKTKKGRIRTRNLLPIKQQPKLLLAKQKKGSGNTSVGNAAEWHHWDLSVSLGFGYCSSSKDKWFYMILLWLLFVIWYHEERNWPSS